MVGSTDGTGPKPETGADRPATPLRSLKNGVLGATFNSMVAAGLAPHAPPDLKVIPMGPKDIAAWEYLVNLDPSLPAAAADEKAVTMAAAYDRLGVTAPRASI